MAIKKVKIVDFGICEAEGETSKDLNVNSPTGYFLHSDEIKFIEKTNNIKAQIGLSFGISYEFESDSNEEEIVDFTSQIKHPKLSSPESKEEYSNTIEEKDGWTNEIGFDYYTFEFDWETIKGEWTFEIIIDKVVMCSKNFNLV